MGEKTLQQLEEELEQMKSFHRAEWDTYGSELCAGDMIAKETKLEEEIAKRKSEGIGLSQLRERKREILNGWEKSGLLEGLGPDVKENVAQLFENQQKQIIKEDPSQIVDD